MDVQPVLGLIEYGRCGRLDHFVGDFFAAPRRQAVQEQRIAARFSEQRTIDLVGREVGQALRLFVLLSHAGPDVGVDALRALDGLIRDRW